MSDDPSPSLLRVDSDEAAPVLTLEGLEAARGKIAEELARLVGPPAVKRVEPDPRMINETDCCSYVRRKITYAVGSGERIAAYLLLPRPETRAPAPLVLCLHGTNIVGKDTAVGVVRKKPGRDFAHELACRGYVTFATDDPVMGERGSPERGIDTTDFYRRYPQWSVMGRMVWDYGRAMDFLSTLPQIDGNRIATIGHSLGASTLLFVAAMDSRIIASVASCGYGTWARCDSNRPILSGRVGGYNRLPALSRIIEADGDVPIDVHDLIALIAPRAVLRINAYSDPSVTCPEVIARASFRINEVYRLLDAERNFAQLFHGDGHNIEPPVRAYAYRWLDEKLGFRPPA